MQYPDPPKTIGDHIKKRRLQLGLRATHVAKLLKVSTDTVYNWEKNRREPMVHLIPRITQFLGYLLPLLNRETMGQKIIAYRSAQGMSQRKLALQLNIDPSTLGRWERDECLPNGKLKKRVALLFRTVLRKDESTKE
jgi:transcriptional regulator with XRE-family HTH domain